MELGGPRRQIDVFAPGRLALEAAVLLSAITILVPVVVAGAVPCALLARRAGNGRWPAALAAAVWCGLLGAGLRLALGTTVVP
jgi:hypothetical protein